MDDDLPDRGAGSGSRGSSVDTALVRLSLLFLAAVYFSFAVVNAALFTAAAMVLTSKRLRGAVADSLPPGLAAGTVALALGILVSLVCSPESWRPGIDREYFLAIRPLLALLVGLAASSLEPDLWRRSLGLTTIGGALFVLPLIPTYHLSRIDQRSSIYHREILGPNVLGGYLGFLFLVLAGETLGARAKEQAGLGKRCLVMAGLLLGVLLSGSRSAFYLLAVGIVVLGAQHLALPKARPALLGMVAGIAAIAIVNSRFLDPTGSGITMSFRFFFWQRALVLSSQRPFLGAGLRDLQDLGDEVFPPPNGDHYVRDTPIDPEHPRWDLIGNPNEFHNDYLSISAQHGLPVLVIWLAFQATLLMTLYRSAGAVPDEARKGYLSGAVAGLTGLLAFMGANAAWFNKELGPPCYLLLGTAVAAARRRATVPPPAPGAATAS